MPRETAYSLLNECFAWLQNVLQEVHWEDRTRWHQVSLCLRLSPLNHTSHFPYFVTFFVGWVMAWSKLFSMRTPFRLHVLQEAPPENFQLTYAAPVMKMQVACDALGRIVFFSGPHMGSRGDSTLWKVWGPKTFVGQEVGLADGAYSGNHRLIAPYRKPPNKPLPPRKERYNKIHAFYRSRIEHVFSRLWPFGIVQQVWRGKGMEGALELQRRIHVLMHLVNFHLKRRVMYEPVGVWPPLPSLAPLPSMIHPNHATVRPQPLVSLLVERLNQMGLASSVFLTVHRVSTLWHGLRVC